MRERIYERQEAERIQAQRIHSQEAKKQAKKDLQATQKGGTSPKRRPEPEPEPEEEIRPHKFYTEGWQESGATLRVLFEFKRNTMLQQTTSFMRDYVVRYPNKDQNCGVEGWLEGGSSNEESVNILLGDKVGGVGVRNRSTVKNSN